MELLINNLYSVIFLFCLLNETSLNFLSFFLKLFAVTIFGQEL